MPHINENGYGFHISDTKWFAEMRSQMRHAFDGVSPALVSLFWDNQITHQRICKHVFQNGDDGPVCVKCCFSKWHDEHRPLSHFQEQLVEDAYAYDESTNPSNGWRFR